MQRALLDVRKRLIELMREDPPFRLSPGGDGPVLDRWMAKRLSEEELATLANLESLFGEDALAELFAEALIEAGIVRASVN
jgi:hypothetical protein